MAKNVSNDVEMIYLDYNATCPIAREVQDSMIYAMDNLWGNPSSNNAFGRIAKSKIEEARSIVARMINSDSEDIIFTSGGTEANNMLINSVVLNFETRKNENQLENFDKPHIIMSAIEHDSIKLPLQNLKISNRAEVSSISINSATGCVDVDEIFAKIEKNTCLISIMLANNETGVVQPVQEIARRLRFLNENRKLKILFHTDAAQMIGKMTVDVEDLEVDYLTIVGHKFYGPRIGAVFVKNLNQNPINSMLFGGGQERGYRPGTENTLMIVGLGKASQLVLENLSTYENHLRKVREYFENQLKVVLGAENVAINFEKSSRLPNTSSVGFLSYEGTGASLLDSCPTVCASTSAACHSHGLRVSAVLLSSGISEDVAKKTVRYSVGRETTIGDIDNVVDKLSKIILNKI